MAHLKRKSSDISGIQTCIVGEEDERTGGQTILPLLAEVLLSTIPKTLIVY